MARGRGKRARPRGRGRLARTKKPRIVEPKPPPPPPEPTPRDLAAEALALLSARLQSVADSRTVAPPALLTETASAVRKHGAARLLKSAPLAPRVVLQSVELGADAAAVSAAVAAFACNQGDDEPSRRAREWGARIAAGMARGEKGVGVSKRFAHGEGGRVAGRDRMDGRAIEIAAERVMESLKGRPDAGVVRKAGDAIARAVGEVPIRAVDAVLIAGVRAPAGLTGVDDSALAARLKEALMSAEGPRLFDELPVSARAALLACDPPSHASEVTRAHASMDARLFRTLADEEDLVSAAGAAAAHDPHLHWAALDAALAASPTHPFARRAWTGRSGHRALLAAMCRACGEAEGYGGVELRLPRGVRAKARSVVFLARSAMASRAAAGAAASMLRETVAAEEADARMLLACEHPLELLALSAGSSDISLAEVLGSSQYGLRAAFLAGRIAAGGSLSAAELKRESKDPVAGAELSRALMLARNYAAWADQGALQRCAGDVLRECRQVHRNDDAVAKSIDDLSAWWGR